MSIVLAVGFCPIAKPVQVWADGSAVSTAYADATTAANNCAADHYNKHGKGDAPTPDESYYVKVVDGGFSNDVASIDINGSTHSSMDTLKLSVGNDAMMELNYYKIKGGNLCIAFPVVLFDMLGASTVKVGETTYDFSANTDNKAEITAVRGQKKTDSAINVIKDEGDKYAVTHSTSKPSNEWLEIAISGLANDQLMIAKKLYSTDDGRANYGMTMPDSNEYGGSVLAFYAYGYSNAVLASWLDRTCTYQAYLVGKGKTAAMELELNAVPDKTVTFKNGSEVYKTVTLTHGLTVSEPAAPTKDGYEFVGWYNNDKLFAFDTPITEDTTLQAKWSSDDIVKNALTEAKNADSGNVESGGKYVYSGVFAIEGTTVNYTVDTDAVTSSEGAAAMNDLARFLGCLYRFDNGKSIKTIKYGGAEYTWNVSGTNKGSNWETSTGTTLVSDLKTALGASVVGLHDTTFTLTLNGTNVTVNYKAIDPWQVTFQSNNGSAVDSQSVKNGGVAERPVDPTRSGYTFAGWYADEGFTTSYSFDTLVTSAITLYAKWAANLTSTLTFTADTAKVKPVQDAIDALSDSSTSAEVRAAKVAYDALDADQKELVSAAQLAKLDAAVAAADRADAEKAAADAFKGTKAAKVTVGANVRSIGARAFANAKKLARATLGGNVAKVGSKAFAGDVKLKSVTVKSSKLTKALLRNIVKGSKVRTIKLSGVSKKAKAKYKKWAPKGVKVK